MVDPGPVGWLGAAHWHIVLKAGSSFHFICPFFVGQKPEQPIAMHCLAQCVYSQH